MKNVYLRVLLLLMLITSNLINTYAQKGTYYCTKDVISESTIYLQSVYNNANHSVDVIVDGTYSGTIGAYSSLKIGKECKKSVYLQTNKEFITSLWKTGETSSEWKQKHDNDKPEVSTQKVDTNVRKEKENLMRISSTEKRKFKKKMANSFDVINSFMLYIDSLEFYSSIYLQNITSETNVSIDALKYMDNENRKSYIQEHQLNGYIVDAKSNINKSRDNEDLLIDNFLQTYSNGYANTVKDSCIDAMKKILDERITERENAISKLEEAIEDSQSLSNALMNIVKDKSKMIYIVIGLVSILMILIAFKIKRHRMSKKPTRIPIDNNHQKAQADIVVRRVTTSILKKQSLEDVHNNSNYFKIDCNEFCEDSAVRRIYLKNTCIKDIYNMYAEDLRNPDNPNEDGCMILGRWVHDDQNDEYYISLEEIVKPGDDAIFKEYELNFGGKIKLKVSDKLRRLRRETNLQYDMTCWVHSHPGLGVFFSNADSSVQMQLKHPTHPKFLIAIVVDILTPNQEFGIFTFKHDMTINSKAEIGRLYSLEEMYKWAVESDRDSFKAEDYYNIMSSAHLKSDKCQGVELSNGAIIDMCQIETEQQLGHVGWAHGFISNKSNYKEYVIKSIRNSEQSTDDEILGCFIVGTHRSIPTIRKVISNNTEHVNFVLFYSTTDGILTSIPVIDGQLSTDEQYYGEEKLEELKIWTRRKR